MSTSQGSDDEDNAAEITLCDALRERLSVDGPDANWRADLIQFPRLLAELEGLLRPDDYVEVAAAMDLPVERVHELFTRAQTAWDAIKAQTKGGQ